MARLILVRHGETEWNRAGIIQGQTDVPLGDLGRRQAVMLGRRLATTRFDAIYSSDLRRCQETAALIVGDSESTRIVARAGLREIHFGRWEGLTREQIVRAYPEEREAVQADTVHGKPLGGESRSDLQVRMVAEVQALASRHDEAALLLIVSHGGSIRSLGGWVLGLDPISAARLDVDNCSISVLDLLQARSSVRVWNETAHLRDLGLDWTAADGSGQTDDPTG